MKLKNFFQDKLDELNNMSVEQLLFELVIVCLVLMAYIYVVDI